MKKILFSIGICVCLVTLAACASAGSSGGGDITGKLWGLTSLNGAAPVANSAITAEFTKDGKLAGSASCNRYTTSYTTSGSNLTIKTPIATTMMACDQSLMDQESAYLQMLGSVKTYSVSGDTLTLKDSSGKSLAVYQAQSQDLAGTSWEVIGYNNGKQAVTSVIAGATLTANFGKDGNLTGNSGCNDYNGPYKVDGNKITIGPLASTMKACDQPLMDQEAQYLAALQSAATYQIDGKTLELRTSDGALAADFTRK